MAGIKDVAKRAGVSISTVSNVLNDTKNVSDELATKVRIAAKELQYQVDPVARSMKRNETMTIGVITADMCGLFYPYVVKGIYDVATKYGYNVSIFDTNGSKDTLSGFVKEREGMRSFISNRVDGIIFCSMVPEEVADTYLKEIVSRGTGRKKTAFVSIERDFSQYGIDSVFTDSYKGAVKAASYLLNLRCRRIGHITGPVSFKVVQDRIKGYKNAMRDAGLPVDDTMMANGDFTHQSGYLAMMALLEQMPDIDGVYVANDQMAIGACMALKERGIAIPDDIKVIGYDNVFVASVVEPPLTTIHVRKREMGVQSAEALIRQIKGGQKNGPALRLELESSLIVRKSTEHNAPSDWILSEW